MGSIVTPVSGQPSNHATELARRYWFASYSIHHWTEDILSVHRPLFVEGFVIENRRRLAPWVEVDVEHIAEYAVSLFEVSGGPVVSRVEALAVRGERLAAWRLRRELVDGSVKEDLGVSLVSADCLFQRHVTLDVEDVDAALALLDGLHAAHPEPIVPGAYEAASARLAAFERAAAGAGEPA